MFPSNRGFILSIQHQKYQTLGLILPFSLPNIKVAHQTNPNPCFQSTQAVHILNSFPEDLRETKRSNKLYVYLRE